MARRCFVLTLFAVLGSGSVAFAAESLLQSGSRIVAELGRIPTSTSISDAGGVRADRRRGAASRAAAAPADALERLEQPALASSGMRKRTKILIYVAAGVGFAASAYAIDRHVVDITPSSLGTRKD